MKKLVLVFAVMFGCSLFSCNTNTTTTSGSGSDTTVVADSDTTVVSAAAEASVGSDTTSNVSGKK